MSKIQLTSSLWNILGSATNYIPAFISFSPKSFYVNHTYINCITNVYVLNRRTGEYGLQRRPHEGVQQKFVTLFPAQNTSFGSKPKILTESVSPVMNLLRSILLTQITERALMEMGMYQQFNSSV